MTAAARDPLTIAREVLDLTHEDETVTVCSVPDNKVAALARAEAASPVVAEQSLFEQRLLRALVVVFALSAAVVVAWFGRGWVAELAAVLPGGGDAVAWSGVAALCLLGNWVFGLLRGHFAHGMQATT